MIAEGFENINIVTLENDFKNVLNNKEATKEIAEIMKRMEKFKVPVHPRIRLYYRLLQKAARVHAYSTSDSLYHPHKYN